MKSANQQNEHRRYLLKNGMIVDGTGSKRYTGSVVIDNGKIEAVVFGDVPEFDGAVLDCTGKIIAPGLIDAHSHNDRYADFTDIVKYYEALLRQGVTTFVAGNCGSSGGAIARAPDGGFRHDPRTIFDVRHYIKHFGNDVSFETMGQWFDFIEGKTPFNIASLVGHGTVRGSISGFANQDPLTPEEFARMTTMLEQALEDGAAGISLGLQYEPGRYGTPEEYAACAALCARYGKPLSIHARALSHISSAYPRESGKFPDGDMMRAFDEILAYCKAAGAKYQFSHAIFVGESSYADVTPFLRRMDQARADGIDVMFDLYSPVCGMSTITVIAPAWLLKISDNEMLTPEVEQKTKESVSGLLEALGFGFGDIRIAKANCADLKPFEGKYITQIAQEMGVSNEYAYLYCVSKSGRRAGVIQYKYSNEEIIRTLAKRDDALFMSDAWYLSDTQVQNPALFGTFTKFLTYARDGQTTCVEDAVRKMTGGVADRYDLPDVGYIRAGCNADVSVFDLAAVRDHMDTFTCSTGTEYVFVNGTLVLTKDAIDYTALSSMPGKPLRAKVTKN